MAKDPSVTGSVSLDRQLCIFLMWILTNLLLTMADEEASVL